MKRIQPRDNNGRYIYEGRDTKEINCEKSKRYYLRNKEKVLEYRKKWRELNEDYPKKWYEKNKDKVNKRVKKIYHENKQNKKFMNKIQAIGYAQYNHQRGNLCLICGLTEKLEFHHTSYELRMGCTLCRFHHQEQTNLLRIIE